MKTNTMKKAIYLLLIILTACSTERVETVTPDPFADCRIETLGDYSAERANPETGLIELDIFPDKESFTKAYINASKTDKDKLRLWENNIVPFYFHESLSENKKKQILTVMTRVESNTNIIFEQFQDEKDLKDSYKDGVRFRDPTNPFAGNASHLGKQGGIQNLTLNGDATGYIIEHEIFHTINHEHEHNRPDRDEHITVLYDNIPINPTFRRQFDKGKIDEECIEMIGEYDITSGMHYGSKNGASAKALREGKVAFTDMDGNIVPTPTKMSEGDYEANRLLYPAID